MELIGMIKRIANTFYVTMTQRDFIRLLYVR